LLISTSTSVKDDRYSDGENILRDSKISDKLPKGSRLSDEWPNPRSPYKRSDDLKAKSMSTRDDSKAIQPHHKDSTDQSVAFVAGDATEAKISDSPIVDNQITTNNHQSDSSAARVVENPVNTAGATSHRRRPPPPPPGYMYVYEYPKPTNP